MAAVAGSVVSCNAQLRAVWTSCRSLPASGRSVSRLQGTKEIAVRGLPRRSGVAIRASAASGGGGGGATVGGSSGGSGGGGGKKKPRSGGGVPHPMRPWTFIYAAFLAVGGTMGYVQASSYKSLGAGLSGAIIMAVCAMQMGGGPATRSAAIVATVVAAALAGVMGVRYSKTKKFMPPGLAAGMSGAVVLGFLVQGF